MLKFNDKLSYHHIYHNQYTKNFWKEVYNISSEGGRFMLDWAHTEPYIWTSRNQGAWSLPWPTKIKDRFKMPAYERSFSKTYEQITNERAAEVAKLIREQDKKFSVLYSGGIDSTLIAVALLKNLSTQELKNVNFYCNTASIIEHPLFYKDYIYEKFEIIDSSKYLVEDVAAKGYIVISSAAGDPLCGSKIWLDLQPNIYYYMRDLSSDSKRNINNHWRRAMDPEVHYSVFKDLIMSHYNIKENKNLGEQYYSKMEKNIKTSNVPVNSLFDFYWWNVFNIKYIHLLSKLYIEDGFKMNFNELEKNMFDWYNTEDYQQWSMANNYTGEKIDFSLATIKLCVRKYIHDFDKNDWYFHFKQKLSSNEIFKVRHSSQYGKVKPMTLFALDEKSERQYIEDKSVQEYILNHFVSFERDW